MQAHGRLPIPAPSPVADPSKPQLWRAREFVTLRRPNPGFLSVFRPLGINIGIRYAFSKRSFIAYVSSLAIFGLALSTAVLLVVLSVVNGFERELQNRILGILPHVTLRAREHTPFAEADRQALMDTPGVVGAAPYLRGPALLSNNDEVRGALLSGIDPATYTTVSALSQHVTPGALDKLALGGFDLVLGSGLAEQLSIELGDELTLVMPQGTVSPLGLHPRQRRFAVVGILHSASEIDQSAAFTGLAAAGRMFATGTGIHGYQLRLADLFSADLVARAALAATDRRFHATTWIQTHGNLYRAIGLQKTTMFVLLSFLVGVAAFNLISTLVMVVNERLSDIAVLRTLGTSTGLIVLSFVTLGLVIGLIGVVLGILGGVGLGLLLEPGMRYLSETLGWNLLGQYFVNYLPVETRLDDITTVAITALALCLISALYPAWRAARLLPTRILKYE